MENRPTPASPVLPYADIPAQLGIQYETRADGVCFVIPGPAWWTRVEVWSLIVLVPVAAAPFALKLPGAASPGSIVQIGVVLVLALAAATKFVRSSRRPVVIELTADELLLENVRLAFSEKGEVPQRLRFARRSVYDVQFVAHSGNLVFRIRGTEMVEIKPARDPRVLAWIATELRRALGLPA